MIVKEEMMNFILIVIISSSCYCCRCFFCLSLDFMRQRETLMLVGVRMQELSGLKRQEAS